MQKAKNLFVLLVLVVLSFGINAAVTFAASEDELRQVEQQLQMEREKLKDAKKKETNALNNFYVVNKKLKVAKEDIRTTEQRIEENKKKISALAFELKDSEKTLKDKSSVLSLRIREAYKTSGGLNLLELMFSSSSVADLLSRYYFFEKVIASDIALIGDIKREVASVNDSRQKLAGTISEMRQFKSEIEERKVEMEADAGEKKKVYESLKERREEYERRVTELEKTSGQIEGLIRRTGSSSTKTVFAVTGKMMRPVPGRVVSGFGYRRHPIWGGIHLHTGLDLAAAYGDPVKAADSGEVIFSGWWDGYGKAVVLDHGRGTSTVYGHMSRIYVEAGQRLEKGQVLGLVGSTGFSTGPHLHFEVRRNGHPVDPTSYIM